MTVLTGQSPASTYGDLLTCTNNGQGLSVVQSNLQDGLGNNSPILIATTSVNFVRGIGQFQIDGTALTSNVVDINSMCQPNPVALGNGAIRIPKGSTAQRPGGPISADFRFNTDINNLEFYTGTIWQSLSAGGTVTSVSGTVGQINVANSTTTPIISLPSSLTGVNSITGLGILSLNSTTIQLNSGSAVNVNGANRFNLNSACQLWLYNAANTFKVALSGLSAVQDATYYFPSNVPTVNNQALTSDTLGFMSWKSLQPMENVIVTGNIFMASNKRYIINAGFIVNLFMPNIFAVGDIIEIVGNSNGWKVIANIGETVYFNTTSTSPGGSCSSTSSKCCVTMVNVSANSWVINSNVGNLVFA